MHCVCSAILVSRSRSCCPSLLWVSTFDSALADVGQFQYRAGNAQRHPDTMTKRQQKAPVPANESFHQVVERQSQQFQDIYRWMERSMPAVFFEEVSQEYLTLIALNLVDLHLKDFFTTIKLKMSAVSLCLDSPDADLRILEAYADYGIKNYRAYVSTRPLPIGGANSPLRIGTIFFTEALEPMETPYPEALKEELRRLTQSRNPHITIEEFDLLVTRLNTRFMRSLPVESLALALDMFHRAQTRDHCQYEVRYNEEWRERDEASLQIMLAWRNTPKYKFLYRVARMVHRHNLVMRNVNATYIDPYSKESILVMSLGLHGSHGQAAWEAADIVDFLRELATIKYTDDFDTIDRALVSKKVVSGNDGNLLRCMVTFIHQALVHVDTQLYRIEHIEEALYRHPELTAQICHLFQLKFDPDRHDIQKYESEHHKLLELIQKLDTGQEENDIRRRTVLRQAIHMIHYTLKTDFYRRNYTAFSFRLDPRYLDEIPFSRKDKFPDLPFAILFIRGMHFFGFHIRFKDLARGGLRTVYPEQQEKMVAERNNAFTECYHLAYTQHKKNKDIPEGGSKGILFLEPFDQLELESDILRRELKLSEVPEAEIDDKISRYQKEQKAEYLLHAQRSYIEGLIVLVNCYPDGRLKAKYMVDYYGRPEYIYLGPDERMTDTMIEWIADYSRKCDYKPDTAFITSKPIYGINHKQYGVTSLGVNVYVEEVLKFIGIDPKQDVFTVKISGGPDGDVAGNLLCNLYRFYPKTAKVLALVDVSGTINDPEGLDLAVVDKLFKEGKPIRYYPPELLHEGGFLLEKDTKREQIAMVQQTLCWRKRAGRLVQDWLSGSEMNHLLRHNVHSTITDLFIPAGGRPKTLNDNNYRDFLEETGKPTSRAIVEGANLYLTPEARRRLERLGVIIIKDSSANKGGVICSSFEVLAGLVLSDEEFLTEKPALVREILDRIQQCSRNEARLLLTSHQKNQKPLSELSDLVSQKINMFTYELLDHLDERQLSHDTKDPLIRCLLSYCLPTLRKKYYERILHDVPEHHKKAIIASHIASQLVYRRGIDWWPSIVDILPFIGSDPAFSTYS